jgi:hypothetical protein
VLGSELVEKGFHCLRSTGARATERSDDIWKQLFSKQTMALSGQVYTAGRLVSRMNAANSRPDNAGKVSEVNLAFSGRYARALRCSWATSFAAPTLFYLRYRPCPGGNASVLRNFLRYRDSLES